MSAAPGHRPSSYEVQGCRFRCASQRRYAMVALYPDTTGGVTPVIQRRTDDLVTARSKAYDRRIVDLVTGEVVR